MGECNRRDFLKMIGASTTLACLPVVPGCRTETTYVRTPKPSVSPDAVEGAIYFDRFGVDQGMIARILKEALSRGGDFSEVFLQHKVTHWVGLEDGQVDRAYTNVDLGAGIRVLKGDATGFAYSEDLSEKSLISAAGTAASVAAAGAPGVQPVSLKAVETPNFYPVEIPWTEVGIDKKIPLVAKVDELARKKDPRIIKVTVTMSDETSNILIANSEGRLVEDLQPMGVLRINCVGRHKGKTETAGKSVASAAGLEFFTPEILAHTAGEAVDWTTLLFDAESPPAGNYPVVFGPGITGILLHEAIGHGMEADFNRKNISIYADRINTKIAPPVVDIFDDGTNPAMRGTINVDDESTPGQRTQLVEKGILRSYMHDLISARHYELESTGSGRRQSFRFPPVPRMRNTYMANGPHKPEEIIRSVKHGLYAENFLNGQVHIGAGDFTFYLKHGRMIENGKLTRVVKDANLIGNGPKVLETMDMVADDLEMYSGAGFCGKDGQRVPVGFGMPTTRAGAISIGGRNS